MVDGENGSRREWETEIEGVGDIGWMVEREMRSEEKDEYVQV